jgi:ApbE superfamily uncharacterized protein (UPF0280 family)
VAARLRGEGTVRVGIRPEIGRGEISHILDLDSSSASWGIATSGLGGRSFTRGIASGATVVARSASMADAAATAIANASFIEDENVIQRPAREIDPHTDIPGLSVTLKVGPLSEGKRRLAIARALQKADHFARKGLIFGAFVAVGGDFAMTDFVKERVVEGGGISSSLL